MGKKLNKINKLVATMLSLVLLLGITSPIKVKAATVTGQDIVNEALYWVGRIPYYMDSVITTQKLNRNNPPPYMDCADFTSSVYSTVMDINIGGWTGAQKYYGNAVDISAAKSGNYSNLALGDLIIFTWPNGSYNNGDHVAIYIGNGQIVHESGDNNRGGNVKVNSLNEYWDGYGVLKNNIISIRRVPGVVSGYKKVHVGEYINVKPFMVTFPIFKDDTSWETYNRLCLLSAPISVKVLDNPSKNVYKVKDCRYGYVGYVYVEENNNYTFTSYQAYSEESLYKTVVNGVQVSDLCSTKWIPGIVEEQLQKDVRTIQISKCNNTSTSYQANLDTKVGSGEALYKIVVDGVQVSDMCSKKWIPGIVEEQLGKDVNDIVITRCN